MKARRRLAHGYDTPAEAFGWKPFGFVDYGYDHAYMTISSFIIWAAVTWGSISVDTLEGIAVLAGSLLWSEYNTRKYFTAGGLGWGTGASWVHNVQAGYCWYHYFVKGQRQLPLFLGSWAEMAGDLGAVGEELLRGQKMYSHKAHYEGATIGMTVAFLLDMIHPKKGKKRSFLWKVIPFATIALLFYQNAEREREEKELTRVSGGPSPDQEEFWDETRSEISLRQKRCDEKACDPEDTITMSGATHTTETTVVRLPRGRLAEVDNRSLSKFSEIDQFGYPRYDPRIDGSRKGANWYRPKKVYIGLDKHGKGVYVDPSIGSSGEIDRLSLGKSRSTPENQPEWSYHTSSTDSIVIPKSDDPRYY